MNLLLVPLLLVLLLCAVPGLRCWRAATRVFTPPPAVYLMASATGLAAFAFAFSTPFMVYSEAVVAVIELGLVFMLSAAALVGVAFWLQFLGAKMRDPFVQLAAAGCFFAGAFLPVAWFVFGGLMGDFFAITWLP